MCSWPTWGYILLWVGIFTTLATFLVILPAYRRDKRSREKVWSFIAEQQRADIEATADLLQSRLRYEQLVAGLRQQRVAQLYEQFQQQSFQQTYQQVFGDIGRPSQPIETKFEVLKSEPKQLTEGEPLDHPSE